MFRSNTGPKQSLLAPLVVAALVCLALGGCGGGEDASGGDSTAAASGGQAETIETSSLSKAEFIKQAEAICAREGEHFLQLISSYMSSHAPKSGESEQEVAAEGVRQTLLPKFQNQIDQIRELGAPAGEEEEVEAILAAMQRAVDALAKRKEVALATDIDQEFRPAGRLAIRYGLEYCAH